MANFLSQISQKAFGAQVIITGYAMKILKIEGIGAKETLRMLLAPDYGHAQAVFRPKCYKGLRNDRMTRIQAELPLLRKGCNDKYHLHPGEAFADASAWPATEREVGILRQCSFEFQCPTVRIKQERFRKITRIPVHHILTHCHN